MKNIILMIAICGLMSKSETLAAPAQVKSVVTKAAGGNGNGNSNGGSTNGDSGGGDTKGSSNGGSTNGGQSDQPKAPSRKLEATIKPLFYID